MHVLREISADLSNLLPPTPDGFTPCSPELGPGIDAFSAAARQSAWRTREATTGPLFRRARVLSARGARHCENSFHDEPVSSALTFLLAGVSVTVTLPARLCEVQSAARGISIPEEREHDEVFRYVTGSAFGPGALVGFAGGWVSRGSFRGDLQVRVYLVADSPEEVTRVLELREEPAIREVACSFEESAFHRAAWRVERRVLADGTRSPRLSATFRPNRCMGGAFVHVETHVRKVSTSTLVIACSYGSGEHDHDCRGILDSVRVARR